MSSARSRRAARLGDGLAIASRQGNRSLFDVLKSQARGQWKCSRVKRLVVGHCALQTIISGTALSVNVHHPTSAGTVTPQRLYGGTSLVGCELERARVAIGSIVSVDGVIIHWPHARITGLPNRPGYQRRGYRLRLPITLPRVGRRNVHRPQSASRPVKDDQSTGEYRCVRSLSTRITFRRSVMTNCVDVEFGPASTTETVAPGPWTGTAHSDLCLCFGLTCRPAQACASSADAAQFADSLDSSPRRAPEFFAPACPTHQEP